MVIQVITYSQSLTQTANSPQPFNLSYWSAYADKLHLSPVDKKEFLTAHQLRHLNQSVPSTPLNNQKPIGTSNPQPVFAGPCINIDFEGGSTNGWTTSSGFHPGFNPQGCCPTPGGQQLVTSGAGVDPAGGFPIVAPGGSFSLRLGNNQTGGEADRIEQTFQVSANNANFTYRYAVVFQDPGHAVADQPAFQIVMLDSLGAQIPCTFYNVAAGGNIPGFFNSPNLAGVVYKPWTNVIVDLTNYIGQNVTIRFTTYDCALGGHYGYAYIDGSCQSFVTGTSDTICAGNVKSYCAPTGVASYTWNGPGISNVTTQCINAMAAGIYTCNTTLVTGCTGPVFTYTLNHAPNPVVSFNNLSAGACAQQYTFTNTSSINNGYIASYLWNFGSSTSNTQNANITFPGPGTYSVSLIATSNKGCKDTAIQNIAIYANPVASFNAPATCKNSVVNFTNTSTITVGTIVSYTWQLGNGVTSQLINPSHIYTNHGSFPVTLSVSSNQGCIASATGTVTIHPLPNVSFNSSNVCLGTGSSFFNNSTIASGAITNYIWDFENDGIPNSTVVNPGFLYASTGTYSVNLQAISNNNCISSTTSLVSVYPNPTAQFNSANVCFGQSNLFNNQSSIQPGSNIISNSWNFGDATYSYASSPSHNYMAAGNYTVQLTVTSNHNCVSTFTNALTVHSLPNVNFTSNAACLNQTTQFNNLTVVNGGTIIKWRWDFENDGIWDDTLNVNPAIVYPNFGSYNCQLQAISNFGCSSQITNPAIVHANPIVGFYTRSSCLGDVSSFTNTSSSADGGITSYQWDFNGDNVIDNIFPNPTFTFSAHGVYLVKLEVQTQYGCTNVKSKSVYVNPKPNPVFAAENKSGCPELCVTFTNSSTIATGAIVTSQWLFGDGSMPSYVQNPKHCYQSGNYNVTLKLVSDSNCISTLTHTNFVTVYPKPVAHFAIEPEEVDENDPTITVKSTAEGASTTHYYINDGSSFNTITFNHTFKDIEKFKPMIVQVVKNEYGCADTIFEILKVKPSFVVYIPNTFTPNGDGLNDGFFAKGVGINEFKLMIFDRWGHKIFETNDINEAWDGTMKGSSEPIKQDVYVWKAYVKDVFNKNHDLTGHVNLIK